MMLEEKHISDIVCRELHIDAPAPDLREWNELIEKIKKQR